MLLKELAEQAALLEGDVVKGNFGKGTENADIEIPKGYKSFKTDGKKIIGVKDDGTEKVISSTSDEKLAQALAKEYNSGGKGGTGLKKVSMMQAFGSAEENILADAGIHFFEKPSYFEDLEKTSGKYKPITQIMFKKVQKELKKNGLELVEKTAKEIYGYDPSGPLKSYTKKPKEEIYVITFANGKRYLCSTHGANTYCMWAEVV